MSKILLQIVVIFLTWIILLVVLNQTHLSIIWAHDLGGAAQHAEPRWFNLLFIDKLSWLMRDITEAALDWADIDMTFDLEHMSDVYV